MVDRVYHHHERWEDYRAGFYALTYAEQMRGARDAARLLSDSTECYAAMSGVVREWENAAEHNLTDMGQNRRAWLGQAACCWALGLPSFVTRQAWNTLMAGADQDDANAIADTVIAEWEGARVDAETLFR